MTTKKVLTITISFLAGVCSTVLYMTFIKTDGINLVTLQESLSNESASVIELDNSSDEAYTTFCNKQKQLLDNYLEDNPQLSPLSYVYGVDKKNAVKLAAVCYNTKTNQESNLLIFSDVGVGCLTFETDSTEVHYLTEYPLIIYEENKIELPLFHYNKGKLIFHRLKCDFNDETFQADFTVLEEADESIFHSYKCLTR